MSILLRKSVLIPLTQFVSALITGAMELLIGETQGYAIDATSINNRSYIGGPDGGEVACRDTSTPANDLSNVPLDSSNLTQSGTSPKIVNWNTFSGPHNLFRYSEDFTVSTVWTVSGTTVSGNATASPDGSTTADQVTQGAADSIGQAVLLSGGTYTLSIYVKVGTATWLRFAIADSVNEIRGWFNVSTGAAGSVSNVSGAGSGAAISATSVGSGWYRVTFSGAGISLSDSGAEVCSVTADAGSTRDTGKTFFVWGAQLNIGSTATDYVPTTAVCSGGVRWTPHNLWLQSQAFDSGSYGTNAITVAANQTSAPDGTTTADKITVNSASDIHTIQAFDSIATIASVTYTFSVYAKLATGTPFLAVNAFGSGGTQWYSAMFDLSSGTITQTTAGAAGVFLDASITPVGNSWYRLVVSGTETDTTINLNMEFSNSGAPARGTFGDVTYTGNGTDAFYLWGAQLNRGPVATPYLVTTSAARVGIPQGYDVTAGRFGMLVESAATNLLVRSEDFSTTWTDGAGSVSINTTTAPDGSVTADTYTEGGDELSQTYATTAGTYTISCFAKAGTSTWLWLGLSDFVGTSEFFQGFNLVTGALGGTVNAGSTFIDSTITPIGNGWYRFTVTGTRPTSATDHATILLSTNGSNTTRDTGNTAFVWGAQVETGSVATSYVPTVAATATRAIDQIKALIGTLPYSTTVGTVYADALCRDLSGLGIPWWFNDAGDANVIKVNYDDSAGVIYYIEAAGVAQLGASGLDIGNAVNNSRSQSTATWQANSFAGSVDGAAIATDTSGSVGVGQTHLAIGADTDSGTRALNGFIYRFVYVPRRVADGSLPTFRYNYP